MKMCKTLEEKHEEVGQWLVSNHRVTEFIVIGVVGAGGGLETQ